MQKIASPQDLQVELQRLASEAAEDRPSREKLAIDLRELADRLAGFDREAGESVIEFVLPSKDQVTLHQAVEKNDEQAAHLLVDCFVELRKKLAIDRGTNEALSRLRDLSTRGLRWDPGLQRNNIFKAAHSLGLKLPSGMF